MHSVHKSTVKREPYSWVTEVHHALEQHDRAAVLAGWDVRHKILSVCFSLPALPSLAPSSVPRLSVTTCRPSCSLTGSDSALIIALSL